MTTVSFNTLIADCEGYLATTQGRCHESEGVEGGTMHWKVGVNTVKTLKFEKGGGA